MKFLLKKFSVCFMTILLSTEMTACSSALAYRSSVGNTNDYYVATDGNDNNPGTLDKPFASVAKAQDTAANGDTVYIRGGTYKNFAIVDSDTNYNYVNEITKSGITYKGYATEVPIFDFSNIGTDKRVCAFYITANAKDVTFQSIKVIGVPVGIQKQSECFRIEGQNIVFNQDICSDNQANDFQSIDASQLTKDRGLNGELPEITFMKPTNNSIFKGFGRFN